MNQITYMGKTVNIGPTPMIVKLCGFEGPAEVARVANAHSRVAPHMRMYDVVRWFCDRYRQNFVLTDDEDLVEVCG